jgi:hypothetical protein
MITVTVTVDAVRVFFNVIPSIHVKHTRLNSGSWRCDLNTCLYGRIVK